MTAFEKRIIKAKLVDHFEKAGFRVSGTDSANITLFSDKPLNEKSVKWGNYGSSSYITSFGIKAALAILDA